MKLCASIIFEELKRLHTVEMSGPASIELCLGRPEFYMDEETSFLPNHLYIASVEHLPQRPIIGKGAVLVCIGSSPVLGNYKGKICLITIKQRLDFFRVFQEVQDIYNRYEEWERTLYLNLFDGAGIKTLVEDAGSLFKHVVFVLDRSFKLVASSNMVPQVLERFEGSAEMLTRASISEFLQDANPILDERKPTVIELMGQKVLTTNLFNDEGDYEGCLCLYSTEAPFTEGDKLLCELFADVLQRAVKNNPASINSESTPLKGLMQALLEEMPLSPSQRLMLDASNNKSSYVCVHLRSTNTASQLPHSYICNAFCEVFENAPVFAHDGAIVGFVDVAPLRNRKTGDYIAKLSETLGGFLEQMRMCAGVSNEFSSLFDIRIHYFQAESATQIGQLISPNDQLYFFSTYALVEMIINSLGGRPTQTYYPKGLAEIIEHDETAGVSYLETLSVFLEENMSYSAAAERLYIHRSTLVDRVARIVRESGIDLKDPNQRLQLEILLKATEIEQLIGQ